MSLLANIFSSDKALDTADNIFNRVADGVDGAIYSKEEQAADKLKAAELKIRVLKAFEPFKLAQRLLALMLVGTFCINVLMGTAFAVISFWYGAEAQAIVNSIIELCKITLVTPVSIVVGFYFAAGLRSLIPKKEEGKKK